MRRARKPRAETRGPSPRRIGVLVAFCLLAVGVPGWFKGRQQHGPPRPTTSLHDLRRPTPVIGDGLVSQWTEIASLSWYHTDKLDKDALASDAAKAEERARLVAECFRRDAGKDRKSVV